MPLSTLCVVFIWRETACWHPTSLLITEHLKLPVETKSNNYTTQRDISIHTWLHYIQMTNNTLWHDNPHTALKSHRLRTKTLEAESFEYISITGRCDFGRCRWPYDHFQFEIFLSLLRRLCWLWRVSMRESIFIKNKIKKLWSPLLRGPASVCTSVRFLLNSSISR